MEQPAENCGADSDYSDEAAVQGADSEAPGQWSVQGPGFEDIQQWAVQGAELEEMDPRELSNVLQHTMVLLGQITTLRSDL